MLSLSSLLLLFMFMFMLILCRHNNRPLFSFASFFSSTITCVLIQLVVVLVLCNHLTHVVWKIDTRNYGAKISKFGFTAQKTPHEIWQRLMWFVSQTNNLACSDSGLCQALITMVYSYGHCRELCMWYNNILWLVCLVYL